MLLDLLSGTGLFILGMFPRFNNKHPWVEKFYKFLRMTQKQVFFQDSIYAVSPDQNSLRTTYFKNLSKNPFSAPILVTEQRVTFLQQLKTGLELDA